jgi:hypothetical protein
VKSAERDGHEPRAPGRVGVSHGVVGLHGERARLDACRESAKQVRRDERVGVDDDEGIDFRRQTFERVLERVALAALLLIVPDEDLRARRLRPRGRFVRAIVGDDVDREPIVRVVDCAKVGHRRADAILFVVRRNHDRELELGRAVGRRRPAPREQRQRQEVRVGHRYGHGQYRQHDIECRHETFPKAETAKPHFLLSRSPPVKRP